MNKLSEINEIVTFGKLDEVVKEFVRLGMNPVFTFTKKTDIGILSVCEVNGTEFKTLCDEPESDDTWNDCGWISFNGANSVPNCKVKINGNDLIGYELEVDDEDEDYEPTNEYFSLLDHLEQTKYVGQFDNVIALATEMAKANNIKLSKLLDLTLLDVDK